MSLDKAMKNLKMDSRLLEYNLNSGILSREEYDKHIKSLPDLSQQAETLKIEEKSSANGAAGESH